jgi:hypothetical protein
MSNHSLSKNVRKIIEDKAAEILDKSKDRYKYETFPSEFDVTLFGMPWPLPLAVECFHSNTAVKRKPVLEHGQVYKHPHGFFRPIECFKIEKRGGGTVLDGI